jgi:hypothetical protein
MFYSRLTIDNANPPKGSLYVRFLGKRRGFEPQMPPISQKGDKRGQGIADEMHEPHENGLEQFSCISWFTGPALIYSKLKT